MITREQVRLFVLNKGDTDAICRNSALRAAIPLDEWDALWSILIGFILHRANRLTHQQQANLEREISRTFQDPADAEAIRQFVADDDVTPEGWSWGQMPWM